MPSTNIPPTARTRERIKLTGPDAQNVPGQDEIMTPPLLPEAEWEAGRTMWDLPGGRQRTTFASLTYYDFDEDREIHRARIRKRIEGNDHSDLLSFSGVPELEKKIRSWVLGELAAEYPAAGNLRALLTRKGPEPPKTPDETRNKTAQTNLRLSDLGRSALERIAEYHGISYTDVVEQLVRREARELDLL